MSAVFLDSNVVCYLFGNDPAKAARARELLGEGPVISVQVLSELCNVAQRKAGMSWSEIEAVIEIVEDLCDRVVLFGGDTQARARAIAADTGYHIFDAQMLASAIEAGCYFVLSEDMQDGHQVAGVFGNVKIRNPFVAVSDAG